MGTLESIYCPMDQKIDQDFHLDEIQDEFEFGSPWVIKKYFVGAPEATFVCSIGLKTCPMFVLMKAWMSMKKKYLVGTL